MTPVHGRFSAKGAKASGVRSTADMCFPGNAERESDSFAPALRPPRLRTGFRQMGAKRGGRRHCRC